LALALSLASTTACREAWAQAEPPSRERHGDHEGRDDRAAKATSRGPLRALEDPEDDHVPTVFARDGWPLAGYHGNRFYLRDEHGRFQLFPGGVLQLDGRGAFGTGVRDVSGANAGSLQPRFDVRRARLSLAGTIHDRIGWLITGDLGRSPQLGSTLVEGEIHRYLRLSFGLQPVAFGMENRTPLPWRSWMERTLTGRFGLTDRLETGALIAGEARRRLFTYEVGVSSGETRNRAESDGRFDYAARLTARPLAWTGGIASRIQIGFSGRIGMRRSLRDTQDVGSLSTDGGWTFFSASRTDVDGRNLRILTSGLQKALGGEVRIPVSRFDFRFEFVALSKETREAEVGRELLSSERFGTLTGSAFYGQLGFWIIGSSALGQPDPGVFRPARPLKFPRGDRHVAPYGLEALVRVESLSMTYRSNNRGRRGDEAAREETVRANVAGAGLRYWATMHASFFASYTLTYLPESGTTRNAAVSPGNVAGSPDAHTVHEVGVRAQVAFLAVRAPSSFDFPWLRTSFLPRCPPLRPPLRPPLPPLRHRATRRRWPRAHRIRSPQSPRRPGAACSGGSAACSKRCARTSG
jgi:hypothetical protein